MRDISFSQRVKAGMSKQDLMKYYVLSEHEFDNILKCLEEIRPRTVRIC